MHEVFEFLKQLTDPESIIKYGGLTLLLFVIFAETGLLIGFFLPGDSLVFISGVICASRPELMDVNIVFLELSLIAAAVLGNITGYWFGKRVGDGLLHRKDSLFFKKSYIELTQSFYEKNGGKTLIIGRFLPIIRTFAPILAGVIKISFTKFMLYNVVGAFLWIGLLSTIGYQFGTVPWVQQNIGFIVIILIKITLIPLVVMFYKKRKQAKMLNNNE
jgi:membrane-associated protein